MEILSNINSGCIVMKRTKKSLNLGTSYSIQSDDSGNHDVSQLNRGELCCGFEIYFSLG